MFQHGRIAAQFGEFLFGGVNLLPVKFLAGQYLAKFPLTLHLRKNIVPVKEQQQQHKSHQGDSVLVFQVLDDTFLYLPYSPVRTFYNCKLRIIVQKKRKAFP